MENLKQRELCLWGSILVASAFGATELRVISHWNLFFLSRFVVFLEFHRFDWIQTGFLFVKNINTSFNQMSCGVFRKKPKKRFIKLYEDSTSSLNFNSDDDQTRKNKLLHISNQITTTKYSIWTFFPKNLYYQFKKPSNLYFLITAIVQSIPYITPLNPLSTILPLGIILSISFLREGLENFFKWRSDKETNSRKAVILNHGSLGYCKWEDLTVGSLLVLKEDDQLPADALILSTSNENGAVYVETSNLDGERNLKTKFSIKETLSSFKPRVREAQEQTEQNVEFESFAHLSVDAGIPDANLFNFDGTLQMYENGQPAPHRVNLHEQNILLRGCVIRNVHWVVAMVLYTGLDTKVMLNSESAKLKQSRFDGFLQNNIIFILSVQTLFSIVSTICYHNWKVHYEHLETEEKVEVPFYVTESTISFVRDVVHYWRLFLLYNTFLPISLVVSIEILKVVISAFMQCDEESISTANGRPLRVFTTSIIEELGQLNYVFTDKTGTLTRNEMQLRGLNIGNKLYGCQVEVNNQTKHVTLRLEHPPPRLNSPKSKTNEQEPNDKFHSRELLEILFSSDGHKKMTAPFVLKNSEGEEYTLSTKKELCQEYLMLLALCHECSYEMDKGVYQGTSPDEITLVTEARNLGYMFLSRKEGRLIVRILEPDDERQETMELLLFFEFDSDRKAQSLIVRHNGRIKLLIKGADSTIMENLDKSAPQPFQMTINTRIMHFSHLGFRTLCMAERLLSENEFAEIFSSYQSALLQKEKESLICNFIISLLLIDSSSKEQLSWPKRLRRTWSCSE